MRAGNLWRGLWGRIDDHKIKVVLMDNRTNVDVFEVMFFDHGREFVATKNGRPLPVRQEDLATPGLDWSAAGRMARRLSRTA